MNRKIVYTFLAIIFSVVANADGLKCYMCSSVINENCKDPAKSKMEPVECTADQMTHWTREMQTNSIMQNIARVFEVDILKQHHPTLPHMACAKMNVKIGTQDVTLRSCQVAKTELVDPCKVGREKMDSLYNVMEFCDLCESDGCNGSSTLSFSILTIVGALILQAINRVA